MRYYIYLFIYLLIVLLFLLDVSLGSLARPHINHIDGSCGGFFGIGYKDWGKLWQEGHNRLLSGFCIAVECDESYEGSWALISVTYGALLSLQDNSLFSVVVSKNYVSHIFFFFF